jgi:tetratricopeptide (TPR) repeat protein
MRKTAAILASVFTTLIFIHSAAAQEAGPFPELVPLSRALELSQASDPLGLEQMVDAAVAFSGASPAGSSPAAARERILAHAARFTSESGRVRGQRALAEAALEYLHGNVLSRYSLLATSVAGAVQSGSYNCVSSAVLYAILARAVGLTVTGVRTADHAFCTVLVDGSPVDVETTNVHGFDPGRRKEFTDSFGAVTGFTYVPPSNSRDRRPISTRELLALILYNRVSEEGQAGRYREAVNPAVSAWAFAPVEDFRETRDIAFSNYATSLAMRGEFARAAAFLEAAQAAWGASPDVARLRFEVTHNWIVGAIQAGRLGEAVSLLADPGRRAVLGESDWTDLSVYLVQSRAEAASAGGGFSEAAEVIAAGIASLGSQGELLRAYEAYVHNAFAKLYNARRLEEARAVLARGLGVYPSSQMLSRDMASLTAAR